MATEKLDYGTKNLVVGSLRVLGNFESKQTTRIETKTIQNESDSVTFAGKLNEVSIMTRAAGKTFEQTTAPAFGQRPLAQDGDRWFDTDDDRTEYLAWGSAWVSVSSIIPPRFLSYHSFDDVISMPDDSTGITYKSNFLSTVDGWNPNSGAALTISGGELIVTVANAGIYRRDFFSASNKTYRLRIWTDVEHTIGLSAEKVDNSFVVIKNGISLIVGYNIIDFSAADGVTYTGIAFARDGGGVSPSYRVSDIYVGTGAYLANSSIDNSGMGKHARVYGATPVNTSFGRGLYFETNDYVLLPSSMCPMGNQYSVDIDMVPNGETGTTQVIYNFFYSYAQGRIGIIRLSATNALRFYFSNGSVAIIFDVAGFFTSMDNLRCLLGVSVNITTHTMLVYRNGELFSTVDITGAIAFTTACVGYLSADSTPANFYKGSIYRLSTYDYVLPAKNIRGLFIFSTLTKQFTNSDWLVDRVNPANAITAQAPSYIGRYLAAHPTSRNNGDSWLVYDTDDTPITRGVYYDLYGTATLVTDATPNAEQYIKDATWDIIWAVHNSYGTITSYSATITYIDNLAVCLLNATTALIDTLASKTIVSFDSVSSGYNVPTADRGLKKVNFDLDTPLATFRDEGTPIEGSAVALGATTCAVSSVTKTFTRSAGSFITDGLVVGGGVRWTGFSNAGNNSTFRVTTLTALVCTCSEATGLVTEGAAASRNFYPIDTMYRKMEIGPTVGMKATDGAGRIIHDIPAKILNYYGFSLGHLIYNTLPDSAGSTFRESYRTKVSGDLSQNADIDMTDYIQFSNSKGVLVNITIFHNYKASTYASMSSDIGTYFVAGGTTINQRNSCALHGSFGPINQIGSSRYMTCVPMPFVSGFTIRVYENFVFNGGADDNEIHFYYSVTGEYS